MNLDLIKQTLVNYAGEAVTVEIGGEDIEIPPVGEVRVEEKEVGSRYGYRIVDREIFLYNVPSPRWVRVGDCSCMELPMPPAYIKQCGCGASTFFPVFYIFKKEVVLLAYASLWKDQGKRADILYVEDKKLKRIGRIL